MPEYETDKDGLPQNTTPLLGDLPVSPGFADYAEEFRAANIGPATFMYVWLIQAIRQFPQLRSAIESVGQRLGKRIDLTKRVV